MVYRDPLLLGASISSTDVSGHRPLDLRKESDAAGRRLLRVDTADEKVYVNHTKDQIKDAPGLDDPIDFTDEAYRDKIGSYYGPGSSGYLDWEDGAR